MSVEPTQSTETAPPPPKGEGIARPRPRLFIAGLVLFVVWISYLAFISSQG